MLTTTSSRNEMDSRTALELCFHGRCAQIRCACPSVLSGRDVAKNAKLAAVLEQKMRAALSSEFWTDDRWSAVRHGLWPPAVLVLALDAGLVANGSIGLDAHAYWAAWAHHLYSAVPEQRDAYLYSPAFAQLIWPLTLLPWPVFCAIWIGGITAAYLWLLAPLDRSWRILALILCSNDIITGNIWALFALVLVFGIRYPQLWAFPILTKVVPIVGPVWFAARREWTRLAWIVSLTVGIAAVSYALAPHAWEEWVRLLTRPESFQNPTRGNLRPELYPSTALSLAVQLPIALCITLFAARTNRVWLLPVAVGFAEPVFTANAFVVLAAIPRMVAVPTKPKLERRRRPMNPGRAATGR